MSSTDRESEHIGAAPHTGRNLGIVAALLALVALAGIFISMGNRSDEQTLAGLSAFTALYAAKCDDRVAGPLAPLLSHVYLGSPKVQALVEEQRAALASGKSCASVYALLHAADFPLPRLN